MADEDEGTFQPFRGIRNRLAARKEEYEKRRLERMTKAEPLHDFRSPAEKASQTASDASLALEQAIKECEEAIEDRDVEKAASLSSEISILAEKAYFLAQKASDIAVMQAKKREKDRILQKHNSISDDEEEEEEKVDQRERGKRSTSPKIAYKKGTSIKERIDNDFDTRRRMAIKIKARKLLEKRKEKSENFDKAPSSHDDKNVIIIPDYQEEEDPFSPIGDID